MSSSFLHSVFDSRPPTPLLSYQDPGCVKDEPPDFMNGLIPFSSTERPFSSTYLRQQIESAANLSQLSSAGFLGSPFLTPDTLSSAESSPFGSEGTTEVDDSFISQISYFPQSPGVPFGTPSHIPPASLGLSQPIDSAIPSFGVKDPLFDSYKTPQDQGFHPNLPKAGQGLPSDFENRFGMVIVGGRRLYVTEINGWEPPQDDPHPFVDVDLSSWVPPPSKVLPNDPESEKVKDREPAKAESRRYSRAKSSARVRRTEKPKTWARRPDSNKATAESRKKRRVETILPMQVNATVEEDPLSEHLFRREIVEGILAGSNTDITLPEGNPKAQAAPAGKDVAGSELNPVPQIFVPDYVYPQPDVARAITQRAAEDERERALAANLRLQEEAMEHDDDLDEETRQLMSEFLIFPEDEDAKKPDINPEAPHDNSLARAFDPQCLPSPMTATSIGVNQGLRPTRSLLDYSASTRRRALFRFRSEQTVRTAATLPQKSSMDVAMNDIAEVSRFGTFGLLQRDLNCGREGLDTFPPSRFLSDINVHAQPSIRVQASA